MLNAGMMMNAVDMNIGCSTPAIQHLRQSFHATGGSALGQDCYIRNTHLHNRFQTATATAVNTYGTHNIYPNCAQ